MIADNSNGDVRAAVRDLESISMGRKELTAEDASDLTNRIIRKNIYDLMYSVFRKNDPFGARRMMMDVDEEPRTVMLWVDENLPYEYRNPGDLVRGYNALSRADIFLGRVSRRQYYGFWSYAGDMMIAGVSTAKRNNALNRDRIRYPMYLSKMSRSKGIRATKAALCQKLADYTHNSTKRVSQDVLDPLRAIFRQDPEFRVMLVHDAMLDEDDVGFLLGEKSDSKKVKEIMAEAADSNLALATPVGEVMTRAPQFVYDDAYAAELLKIFEKRRIDDLPVCTREGKVVGLVDIQDLPKMKVL